MTLSEAKAILEAESDARMAAWKLEPHSFYSRIMRGDDPWYVRAYWRVQSFVRSIVKGEYYRAVKNRVLRAKRGYGPHDWFDLNDYIAEWLPSALRELAGGYGYPLRIHDYDGAVIYEHDDEGDDGPRIWAETLERMAQGFEAFTILSDVGWMRETEAERELERIHDEGMQLFARNYSCLWD